MYLVRKKLTQSAKAHVWLGRDTVCRMASTGGLRLSKYKLVQEIGPRSLCLNCLNLLEQPASNFPQTAVRDDLIAMIPRERETEDQTTQILIGLETAARI